MKKWLLTTIIFIAAFGAVSFGLNANAQATFQTGFDSFSEGTTTLSDPYITTSYITVAATATAPSQPNAWAFGIEQSYVYFSWATTSENSGVTFNMFLPDSPGGPGNFIMQLDLNGYLEGVSTLGNRWLFTNTTAWSGAGVYVYNHSSGYDFETYLTNNKWYSIDLSWDLQAHDWTMVIDGGDAFDRRLLSKHTMYEDITETGLLKFDAAVGGDGGYGPAYLDDLVVTTPGTSTAITEFNIDTTSLNIGYPYECRINIVSTSTTNLDFYVSGNFQNFSTGSEAYTYKDLTMVFRDTNNEISTSVEITACSSIEPYSACGFAQHILIPDAHYSIEYFLRQYDSHGIYVGNFVSNACRTYIGSTAFTDSELRGWGEPCYGIYEDCVASSTSWTEKILCAMERVGLALVCPSRDTLDKAIGIKKDVENRFPVSLFTAAGEIVSDMAESSYYTTSTATSSMFSTDISPMWRFSQIQGFQDFRSVMIYLCWISTGLLCIYYINKHGFLR